MSFRPFIAKYFQQRLYKRLNFPDSPSDDLELIVCLPAFKEPALKSALKSLESNSLDPSRYEIHVLINYPENAGQEIIQQSEISFSEISDSNVQGFIEALPEKHAGVGLARKILMDNAALRFSSLNKPGGVILTFDGDCTCVNDHLFKVSEYFKVNAEIEAASIYYEHPYGELDEKHKEQIVDYELHLRCYINWKKKIGLPYAFQTIGSSMAVRAGAYTAKGGMNKRKAGEDFYFLHKFTGDGKFGEIKSTCVYPSSRVSDRVPFGTGRAILEAKELGKVLNTYNPKSFLSFRVLLDQIKQLYLGSDLLERELDEDLVRFLKTIEFESLIDECRKNASTFKSFEKRFFKRFDAFQFMKYLHHMRDQKYPNLSSLESANSLLRHSNLPLAKDNFEALEIMRKIDKS